MKNNRQRIAVLLSALALIAAACGTTEPETTESPETTAGTEGTTDTAAPATTVAAAAEPVVVRAAITGGEATLNPYTYVSGFPGWNLMMLQYDALMQFDLNGEPQPWLAETITPSADLTVWELTLAEGVTWHDGMPVTAADVEFTFKYFVDNAAGRFARDLKGVESVVVHGDLGLTVTLSGPNPSFELAVLADVPILPQHVWESIESPTDHAYDISTNIGSGPYMLTGFTEDQSYRFAANPDYFRGAPEVDELVVVVFGDDSGPLAAIRSGEIDVIFERVSPEQIDLLDAQDPIDISQGPEFTTQMINFDTSKAPFSDLAVRQAMALAIDKSTVVDILYLGAATVGSPGWVHPGKTVYNTDVVAQFDPAAANKLLDDAGYLDTDDDGIREFDGGPMEFEMITNSSDSLRLRIAELTAEMLADVGIKVNVASVETATWEQAVWPGFDVNNGRNYDMAAWGWSAPVQANTVRIAELVHGDPGIGFLNLTGFSDPEVDAVAEALAGETDPAVAEALVKELQVLLAERVPFILLAYPDGAYAYNSDVYDGWAFVAGQGIVSKVSLLPESGRP
jgi:peptide/nickel transport system substrate-binding protein